MSPELVGQATDFLLNATPKRAAKIALVGDLMLDRFIFGSVDRISPEAPVPVLLVERSLDQPGGAANVARNIATLMESLPSLSMKVFGAVGQDDTGRELVGLIGCLGDGMGKLGTRIESGILNDDSRPTTIKTRFLAGAGHQLLRVDVEKQHPVAPELYARLKADIADSLKGLACIVVQDYAKGFLTEDFLQWLLHEARKQNVPTIVDPNRNTPSRFYKGAWLLKPNVAEAESLLGRPLHKGIDDVEIADAALELKEKFGLVMSMITRSSRGITLVDEHNRVHHFPASARAVFDVTGAGDTVLAVFAAAFASGASVPVACTLANAAASVVVAKVGTATAHVDEIVAELRR